MKDSFGFKREDFGYTEKPLSKGERLEIILNQVEEIHKKMNLIFEVNNVPYLQLNQLPDIHREMWIEYQKEASDLMQKSADIILSKP